MFSLESPHRSDSNEYTQYTISQYEKEITLNYPKSAAMGFFSKGTKNEYETGLANEPSVFEPLKVYCMADDKFTVPVRQGFTLFTFHILTHFILIDSSIVMCWTRLFVILEASGQFYSWQKTLLANVCRP